MSTYAKIWYPKGNGVLVEIQRESPLFVYCRRVHKDGSDKSFVRADGVIVEEFELIHKASIKKTVVMVMNKFYGELEVAP